MGPIQLWWVVVAVTEERNGRPPVWSQCVKSEQHEYDAAATQALLSDFLCKTNKINTERVSANHAALKVARFNRRITSSTVTSPGLPSLVMIVMTIIFGFIPNLTLALQ